MEAEPIYEYWDLCIAIILKEVIKNDTSFDELYEIT